MTIRIFTIAHVPEALHKAWLQHLRDFDTAHPGCHFEVLVDAPDSTWAEMVEALTINPKLTFEQVIERKGTPPKTFTTTVVGVGPFCVEFPDGEIITTRSEARQAAIADFVR